MLRTTQSKQSWLEHKLCLHLTFSVSSSGKKSSDSGVCRQVRVFEMGSTMMYVKGEATLLREPGSSASTTMPVSSGHSLTPA